jgi:Flp pilus assembly protein TadB
MNDPFGRLERRHQAGYEAMRDSLRKGGVKTKEEARELMRGSEQRVIKFLAIALGVALLLTLLFPSAVPVVLAAALFLLVWVITFTINGRRYINRFIEEDLGSGEGEDRR